MITKKTPVSTILKLLLIHRQNHAMQTMTRKTQYSLLLGFSFFAVMWAAINTTNPSMPVVNHIAPTEAHALIETGKTLVIDVREKSAYDKGHLPNAISVPIGELDKRMVEFEAQKTEEIIVYCNEGSKRGPRATHMLNNAGYPGAKNLSGGIEAWRKAMYLTLTK